MAKLSRLTFAPTLALALSIACGDSGSSQGGDGTGNSANGPGNGGNGGSGASTGQNTGGSGATGGGTTTNMGGSGGTGGGGADCPSEVSNVDQTECSLYLQNCPSSTDTCDIGDADTSNQTFEPIAQCFTQNGLKGISETCNGPDECQAHLTCVGGLCTPFCCPEDPNSCGGGTCNVDVDLLGPDNVPTGFSFKACSFSPACELFNPDSCDADENCYLGGTGPACYQGIMPPTADGADCEALNECLDSSICIGSEMPYQCHYLCIINSNAAPGLGGCPAGQSCDINSFDSGIPNVGFCHS